MPEPGWMPPARRSGNESGSHFVEQVSGTFSYGPIETGSKILRGLCWHTVAWRACCTPHHREWRNELVAAAAASDCAARVHGSQPAADLARHSVVDPGLHLCQPSEEPPWHAVHQHLDARCRGAQAVPVAASSCCRAFAVEPDHADGGLRATEDPSRCPAGARHG